MFAAKCSTLFNFVISGNLRQKDEVDFTSCTSSGETGSAILDAESTWVRIYSMLECEPNNVKLYT